MKNKRKAVIAATTTALLFATTLCACSSETTPPPPEDHVAPVISGMNTVRIDLDTEKFDVMDGVSVFDKNDVGDETDLTSEINITYPAGVNVVNGEVSFEKAGDYIFTYTVSDAVGNTSFVNRKVEVRNVYNLYWVSATLPVLYCALDMVSNDYKSILVFTRSDTLNIDELSDERFLYKANGAWDNEMREAWKIVGRISNDDMYSYFRLFIVDVYSPSELFSMVRYNIPTERYEVKLLSDGSYTYNTAFPYRSDNTFELWQNNKKLYNDAFDKALRCDFGEKDQWGLDTIKVGDTVVGSTFTDAVFDEMAIIAAQRPNVELWCAYPETLKSADIKVQAEIDKAHLEKIQPEKIYGTLSDEQREKFLKICNLDKTTFDKEYFSEDGKYLIITGTSPVSGSLGESEFITVLDSIRAQYPDYNILFKPHPVAVPSETYYADVFDYFKENSIKILPGRLPMEVLSWVYNDVHLGGFDSSLFMSVPQGNVDFFIAESKDKLSALSKQMYEAGAFGDAKFYWKA